MRRHKTDIGISRTFALVVVLNVLFGATPSLAIVPVDNTEVRGNSSDSSSSAVDEQSQDPVDTTTDSLQLGDGPEKGVGGIVESERVESIPGGVQPFSVSSAPIRDTSSFSLLQLMPNDDGSSSQIILPFSVKIDTTTYQSLFVNNNGNVTFDSPMSTYTPQPIGLLGRPIFAPFWADVDTRGIGTVQYGIGNIDGRSAFVVNWNEVGYFSYGTDKTATFQLVLLSRPDQGVGAVDLEFNYSKVEWETGSASGGSGGFGGYSARAGISSGTGETVLTQEEPGSGEPGNFLDSSPTGLVHRTRPGSPTGRLTYTLRNGWTPTLKAVVLGDSYSSGEGTYSYGLNERCHRSDLAWANFLDARSSSIEIVANFACSGAVIENLTKKSQSGQSPQLTQLETLKKSGQDVDMVLFTIGGNDAGFSTVLTDCYISNGRKDCSQGRAAKPGPIADSIKQKIQTTILPKIQKIAPKAIVVLVGYPRLFPRSQDDVTNCGWLKTNEREVVNGAVATISARGAWLEQDTNAYFVSSLDALSGHELCTVDSYFNPILGKPKWAPEQGHPNSLGYQAWGFHIYDALKAKGLIAG